MASDPAELRARREERRAAVQRRRRIVGVGVVGAAALALAAAVVTALGGGDGSKPAVETGATSAATPGKRQAGGSAAGTLPAKVPADAPGAHPAPDEPVPILMYHVIGDAPDGAPYPELYVSGEDFAGQMESLRSNGYHAVTQQQMWDAWNEGGLLPSKPVVVSFDDGYQGVYKRALPVLRKLRWPGVLNLEVKLLDEPDEGGITEAMVRGLVRAGWEIDSHSVNHSDLTQVSPEAARAELVDSREQIRKRFGAPANFFCYPAGKYDAGVEEMTADAGYLAATTVEPGVAVKDRPYALPRVRIDGGDGIEGFERKLGAAVA